MNWCPRLTANVFVACGKRPGQTYTEFVQELTVQCNRWCSASQVESQEELFNLILVEQFKNCLPEQIATYVSERNATTGPEAATLADDYALIHKARFFGAQPVRGDRGTGANPALRTKPARRTDTPGSRVEPRSQGKWDPNRICNYCLGKGHWKFECPMLKGKERTHSPVKYSALAISVPAQKTSGPAINRSVPSADLPFFAFYL